MTATTAVTTTTTTTTSATATAPIQDNNSNNTSSTRNNNTNTGSHHPNENNRNDIFESRSYDTGSAINEDDTCEPQIFERNVEDPYILTKTASNSNLGLNLSRNASHTSLLQRRISTSSSASNRPRYFSTSNLNTLTPQLTNSSSASLSLSRSGSRSYNNPDNAPGSPDYVLPNHNSLDHHHNLENFVPPALDAGCSIVTDKDTNLDDIDMIYSKRPSTIGLDLALGRTSSFSTLIDNNNYTNYDEDYNNEMNNPSISLNGTNTNLSNSSNNNDKNINNNGRNSPRLLRFYSYVDMLSDENIRRNSTNNNNNTINGSVSNNPIGSNRYVGGIPNNNAYYTNRHRPSLINHYSSGYNQNFRLHLNQKQMQNDLSASPSTSPTQFTNPFVPSNVNQNSLLRRYSNTNSPFNNTATTNGNTKPNNNILLRKSITNTNPLVKLPSNSLSTTFMKSDKVSNNTDKNESKKNKLLKNSRFHIDSSGSEDTSTDEEENYDDNIKDDAKMYDDVFEECNPEALTDTANNNSVSLKQPFSPPSSYSNVLGAKSGVSSYVSQQQKQVRPRTLSHVRHSTSPNISFNTTATNNLSSTLFRPRTLSNSTRTPVINSAAAATRSPPQVNKNDLFKIQTTEPVANFSSLSSTSQAPMIDENLQTERLSDVLRRRVYVSNSLSNNNSRSSSQPSSPSPPSMSSFSSPIQKHSSVNNSSISNSSGIFTHDDLKENADANVSNSNSNSNSTITAIGSSK
ncbi:Vhs2p NDAI_0B03900 [Naumovozyma dairenensis CBS 421]|uniref:Uncharacterized protein n=1 Tax=Naumovozyma dairenensis (strain ATCC 10597 / BCRC 20456 / CBS 421 / NBRC 0211 / NRRL Y-12639) TaxID=1071378 RepID=G0W6L3_NAUDC|nr:hypothetical protein NDAI_0B03900 [Naumovozyma dairenensis CBS 421]CCD23424.1 hypothetical protein NDAI_0B03900 [Naumovozyma dairenensis CBS 421]